MAHHSATKKAIRQTAKRTERNRAYRTQYRNAIKKVRSAIEAKDKKALPDLIKNAQITLDRSVTKGVIKRETASRYLSRLNAAAKKVA